MSDGEARGLSRRHLLVVGALVVLVALAASFTAGYYTGYSKADNSPGDLDVEEYRAIDSIQGDGEIGPTTVHFNNGTDVTFQDPKKAECVAYQHGLINYTPVGCCHKDPEPDYNQPDRYLEALQPATGPDGEPIEIVDASYEDGTLTVSGKMTSTSMYPILTTIQGIEDPLFIDPYKFPYVEELEIQVLNCGGDVIATQTIRREWVLEFWDSGINTTAGDYVNKKKAAQNRTLDHLSLPGEIGNESNWTCSDWVDSNPELTEGSR